MSGGMPFSHEYEHRTLEWYFATSTTRLIKGEIENEVDERKDGSVNALRPRIRVAEIFGGT